MSSFVKWAAVAASLVLAACGGDDTRCSTAHDCQGDQICKGGVCARPDGGAPGKLGDACGTSGDCETGTACETDAYGFTGGVCSRECSAAAPCPAASSCVDLRSSLARGSVCLPTCTSDATCRGGYACCAAYGKACVPAGMCPASSVPASATVGGACAQPADCGAGEECRVGQSFPGGVCTRPCVLGQPSTCSPESRCVDTAVGALCLPSCTGATCRAGYACGAIAGSPDTVCSPSAPAARTCAPPGTPKLVAGGVVGPPSAPASCLKPKARSALPAAQVLRLGTHRVGTELSFTVPAGTTSISIVSQAVSTVDTITYKKIPLANTVVPTLVRTPNGATIFDDSAALPADLTSSSVYYGTASAITGVMTIPNTTAGLDTVASGGVLPAGVWRFAVNDFANECANTADCTGGTVESTYDLSVLLKGGPQASGTVDVAFYLVGGTLNAGTAATNPRVGRMVTTLGSLFANLGLCLGTVTFYDVPAWARTKYATSIDADKDGACDSLSQMFTLARSANTLNFFLVEAISSSSAGGQVVGIDGTIPGPSTLGGTVHSGAAVTGANLLSGTCTSTTPNFGACGADQVAYIAAHEAGHWLGLYHTSESTGGDFDPLSDTATCQCQTCGKTPSKCNAATDPTLVLASDCTTAGCGGGDNLMFWLLDQTLSKGRASAQQGRVARANAIVQ